MICTYVSFEHILNVSHSSVQSVLLICRNGLCLEANISSLISFKFFPVYCLISMLHKDVNVLFCFIILERRRDEAIFSKISIYSLKIQSSYSDVKYTIAKFVILGFYSIVHLAFDSLSLPVSGQEHD